MSSEAIHRRPFIALVLCTYLAIGLAAFFTVLNLFFQADDFAFLNLAATSSLSEALVSPLAGRYFRPMVVLFYYTNYQLAGLFPVPYHLTLLLIHVCNAWLVFLIGLRIFPSGSRHIPALAGLLFVVFAGHAEAVGWLGGAADPLLTFFVLLGLLFFFKLLEPGASSWFVVGVWAAFVGALTSKELAGIFPALVAVCAVVGRAKWPDRAIIYRTIVALSVPLALLAAYPFVRNLVLGFPFVKLAGLGTSPDLLTSARHFVIRSFFPPGWLSLVINYRLLDVLVILPVAIGLAWWRISRSEYRPLALLGLCFALTIGPVVPLSISLATAESERVIYLATAFASLLTVAFADAVLRRRALVFAAVLVWCGVHLAILTRSNHNQRDAAALAQSTLSSFGEAVRVYGKIGKPIFLLNAVDHVRGAYVFRRGFHEGLALTSSDQIPAMAETYVVSVFSVHDTADTVRVTQHDRTMEVDLGAGTQLVGPKTASNAWFEITDWGTNRFSVRFTPQARDALVLYLSPTKTVFAGRVP